MGFFPAPRRTADERDESLSPLLTEPASTDPTPAGVAGIRPLPRPRVRRSENAFVMLDIDVRDLQAL